jgi:hypothetical protein
MGRLQALPCWGMKGLLAAARSLALEAAGIIAPELHPPPSHRLVGHDNAPLQQHLLDQAKAQRKRKYNPSHAR